MVNAKNPGRGPSIDLHRYSNYELYLKDDCGFQFSATGYITGSSHKQHGRQIRITILLVHPVAFMTCNVPGPATAFIKPIPAFIKRFGPFINRTPIASIAGVLLPEGLGKIPGTERYRALTRPFPVFGRLSLSGTYGWRQRHVKN